MKNFKEYFSDKLNENNIIIKNSKDFINIIGLGKFINNTTLTLFHLKDADMVEKKLKEFGYIKKINDLDKTIKQPLIVYKKNKSIITLQWNDDNTKAILSID